jgi:hypothetical protein
MKKTGDMLMMMMHSHFIDLRAYAKDKDDYDYGR